MKTDIRIASSPAAQELHIVASWNGVTDPRAGAKHAFDAVADVLKQHDAVIAQERVFLRPNDGDQIRPLRQAAYGKLADTVQPNWLMGDEGQTEGSVQVYALRGVKQLRNVATEGNSLARVFELGDYRFMLGEGISPPPGDDPRAEARTMYDRGVNLLSQCKMTLHDVARTWIFMDDICGWYGEFNQARNTLFIEQGLLKKGTHESLAPASTGIGVRPAASSRCALDFYAVKGPGTPIRRFDAAGKQRSAFEYGSAFARASEAVSPAGKTVFISGTAAIDLEGRTIFLDDIKGQIRVTLDNVIAVLRQLGCEPRDVVQAMAYCKTPDVEKEFRGRWKKNLDWPWVTCVSDVCRDDLLFEVEVAAVVGSKKL